MRKEGIPANPPATIIGTMAVEALHAAGFRIVPAVATTAMKEAARNAMWKRRAEGATAWVSEREKAAIRWEAMLAVWILDYEGLAKGRKRDPEPEIPTKRRWRLGRWFEMDIGWLVEKH